MATNNLKCPECGHENTYTGDSKIICDNCFGEFEHGIIDIEEAIENRYKIMFDFFICNDCCISLHGCPVKESKNKRFISTEIIDDNNSCKIKAAIRSYGGTV